MWTCICQHFVLAVSNRLARGAAVVVGGGLAAGGGPGLDLLAWEKEQRLNASQTWVEKLSSSHQEQRGSESS